mgnify:CR=1 FL=1
MRTANTWIKDAYGAQLLSDQDLRKLCGERSNLRLNRLEKYEAFSKPEAMATSRTLRSVSFSKEKARSSRRPK